MLTAKSQSKGVLVVYTGGTIGSAPREPDNPKSPQYVVPWKELKAATPELERLQTRGFGPIDAYSLEPPLDSCNVGPREWAKMANVIAERYEEYEGFVILHGTDTMVYTASVLSFMLRELAKPVVITGAQRSALVDIRNDATQNVLSALEIANPPYSGLPIVPEVCIVFGDKLLRGNRSIKWDTAGYVAYQSPNFPPLGEIGDRIVINERLVRPVPDASRRFHVRTTMNTNVTTVFIYPGIQDTQLIRRQLLDADLKGIIVLAYGSGNIPTKPEFLEMFEEAQKRGVILANLSQCRRGPVELGIYDTSATLLEMGFIAGSDITMEAAQCKLMVLLGDPDITPTDVKKYFAQNRAGEQSVSLFVTEFEASDKSLTGADVPIETSHFRIPGRPMEGVWKAEQIERALLRFRGATVKPTEKEQSVTLRVFANLNPGEEPGEDHPGYVGPIDKYPPDVQPTITIIDVTDAVRPVARPGDRISFTVFVDSPGATFSWKSVELALFVKEMGE